jgi:hypothetical protein
MWYEGAFQYHFYGYHSLLQYVILVENTAWDLRKHPALKRMFDFPLGYILPDGTLPNLNDASYPYDIQRLAPYYEIALDWYRDARYRQLLCLAYGLEGGMVMNEEQQYVGEEDLIRMRKVLTGSVPANRDSLEALWFGETLSRGGEVSSKPSTASHLNADTAEVSLAQLLMSDTTSDASGLTKLVNRKGWHLLVKHSKFGGEHDHMDRLGLSFAAGSVPLFVDPGTTAYGVPAHYGWFKHTYSHNTVSINGKDQPPADGKQLQYHQEHWGSWVESAVHWNDSAYEIKDSIILPQEMCPWDEQAYDGVNIRRVNVLTEHLLLDMVKVTVPDEREMDLLYHLSGKLEEEGRWHSTDALLSELSEEWLQDKRSKPSAPNEALHWKMSKGRLQQASWCSEPVQLIAARTVDNPPSRFRQTLVQRVSGSNIREAVFINAFVYDDLARSHQHQSLASELLKLEVTVNERGGLLLELTASGVKYCFRLDWKESYSELSLLK